MIHKFAIQILASKMLLCYLVTSPILQQHGEEEIKAALRIRSWRREDKKLFEHDNEHDKNYYILIDKKCVSLQRLKYIIEI